ncbi:MAG: SCO family protein [Acidimicrobiales bacterium]
MADGSLELPAGAGAAGRGGRAGAETQGAAPGRARRRIGSGYLALIVVVIAAVLGGGIGAGLALSRPSYGSYANLMGLSDMPSTPAPGFTLTDQHGRVMSLSSFRGRAVVLEFMDPHCTDICPLVSQEFVDAYHDLGSSARHVTFVAVNVNRYVEGQKAMESFSEAHGLSSIPSWHFFTGSTAALSAVWKDYGIYVHSPSPTADVIHSSYVFFIDPQGRERYLASPMADHRANGSSYLPVSTLSAWGHGIASYARRLES